MTLDKRYKFNQKFLDKLLEVVGPKSHKEEKILHEILSGIDPWEMKKK